MAVLAYDQVGVEDAQRRDLGLPRANVPRAAADVCNAGRLRF